MSLKSLIPIGRKHNVAGRESTDIFSSLHREIDRLFEDFTRSWPAFGSTSELTPSMDVTETDKEIEVTAELPGLQEKDVQINVSDNILTIKGEKKAEKEEKDKNYRVFERSYGSFYRSMELPAGVNADAIQANLSNGVLKISVPKPTPAEVKKVEIKSAA
jgi:HSP20 family protein